MAGSTPQRPSSDDPGDYEWRLRRLARTTEHAAHRGKARIQGLAGMAAFLVVGISAAIAVDMGLASHWPPMAGAVATALLAGWWGIRRLRAFELAARVRDRALLIDSLSMARNREELRLAGLDPRVLEIHFDLREREHPRTPEELA